MLCPAAALVSLGMFIASFVSSRRVATVVGYIVALFGNLICLVVADGIYGDIPPFSIGSPYARRCADMCNVS